MLIIFGALCTLAVLLVLFYKIIPFNKPSVFWAKIELFWVMVSFMSVLYATIEVIKIDDRIEYEEMHNAAKIEFEEAQLLLGEHAPALDPRRSSEGQKIGREWFHTMVNLMDEGYESPKWEGFVNYTEGFMFKEKRYPINEHIQALRYHWPEDPSIKSDDIEFKHDIKVIADRLEKIEQEKERLLKQAPNSKPVNWPRYVIASIFLIALSLKILKIRHEAYK